MLIIIVIIIDELNFWNDLKKCNKKYKAIKIKSEIFIFILK